MTRDEFLQEKIGSYTNHDISLMSRWEKFGLLWEWAKEQDTWWYSFIERYHYDDYTNLIHPDHFADAVSRYLGWEEK